MTKADKITTLRIVLAPVFFVVYFLPAWFPAMSAFWTVPALWALFGVSQLTDMIDGMAARRCNEVSDFGKLYDPFADTLMQLTCFLSFVVDGILPFPLLLVVLYREYGVLFIRNLMLKKGVSMGARMGGKIKTVTYIAAGCAALLVSSLERLGRPPVPALHYAAVGLFSLSVLLSVVSFFDYLSQYRKAG